MRNFSSAKNDGRRSGRARSPTRPYRQASGEPPKNMRNFTSTVIETYRNPPSDLPRAERRQLNLQKAANYREMGVAVPRFPHNRPYRTNGSDYSRRYATRYVPRRSRGKTVLHKKGLDRWTQAKKGTCLSK